MKTQALIEKYDALIERAIEAARFACRAYVSEEWGARLSLDGDTAVLTWPETEYAYGDTNIVKGSAKFDASVLTLNEAAFGEWKAQQQAKVKAENERRSQEAAVQREAIERAQFEVLKQKFHPI